MSSELSDIENVLQAELTSDINPHYLEREFQSLMASPDTLRFLEDGALDGLWYWDLKNPEHEWMSPGFWRTLGFDPASKQHLASEWQHLIFPEDGELALRNFHAHLADPSHPYDQLVRYRTADGGTVTIRCRGLAIWEGDEPTRMLGAHTVVHDTRNHEADRQLSEMLELSGDAMFSWSSENGIIRWNRGAERLYGFRADQAIGRDPEELLHVIWPKGWDDVRNAVEEFGEWSGQVERHSTSGQHRFTSTHLHRVEVRYGNDTLYMQVDRDITERVEAETHQKLLMDELNHRVKNTLAIVQAISQQTFGRGEANTQAFQGRLEALGAAHGLLTRKAWIEASLREIIVETVDICPKNRVMIDPDGPKISLKPTSAVSFGLAFHELCTNAMKYGALSTPNGQVHVSWTLDEGAGKSPQFILKWIEGGGPTPDAPDARGQGFGMRMIKQILASDMQGSVEADFHEDGLRVIMSGLLSVIGA